MKTALKLWTVSALLGIVSLVAPGRASADYFQFGPPEQYGIVTLTDSALGLNGGSYYAGDYLGQIGPNLVGGHPSPATSFYTYCVDLTHEVSNGDVYAINHLNTGTTPLANNSSQIAYLYQQYGGNGLALPSTIPSIVINHDTFTGVSANDFATAIQVAIWDELAGDTLSGSNVVGPLTVGFSSNPHAQSGGTGLGNLVADLIYMANANGASGYTNDYVRDVAYPAGHQAFLTPGGTIPNLSTPEPSTLVLASMSLGIFAPLLRWRRKQSA